MSYAVEELWSVAGMLPQVDAEALARAIESAAQTEEALDYRTRLLIRDGLEALRSHWGEQRLRGWLDRFGGRSRIEQIVEASSFDQDPAEIGFPSLSRRIVDFMQPETVLEFFRVLASGLRQPIRLNVGGSLCLILRGWLARRTEDVNVVNEVPRELRDQHDLLHELARRFGLQLTHFQSRYLPDGWEDRLQSFQVFGLLDVHLVDVYDVIISKLCSHRAKDLDDLRATKPHMDLTVLTSRLRASAAGLLSEPRLREAAKHNWYILFGQDLPA